MFFKNKNTIRIGKIERELRLKKSFFGTRWKFKRVLFRTLKVDLSRMMNPHIVLIGESGSGKSNACKDIIGEISSKGIGFIVFDAHDEYLGLADSIDAEIYDASYTGVNFFEIAGKTDASKAGEISGTLKRILGLGYIQSYVLYKAILYMYQISERMGRTPNMHDLMYTVKVFEKNASKGELGILRSLEHRLTPLVQSAFAKSVKVEELMGKRSVFALSGLGNVEAQAVYMESFLRKIYTHMLGFDKCHSPRFFVVIEEAGKLGEGSMLNRIVAEGRKYGIGVIVVAQRAKSIDREIRSNAELLVAFYQREPEELNYLANIIAGGNEMNRFVEVKRSLRNLGRGRAIVSRSRGEPQIIRFDPCGCPQRSLAMEAVRLSRDAISDAELKGKLCAMGFSKEAVGDRIRKLSESKTLQHYEIGDGAYKGTWQISNPRNSAEHDILVNLISRHLASLGVRNSVYNNSFGPDVIAFFDGKRIAVEYETGSKDQFMTRRMLELRKGKYDGVLLVVNDAVLTKYSGMQGESISLIKASDFLKTSQPTNLTSRPATSLAAV